MEPILALTDLEPNLRIQLEEVVKTQQVQDPISFCLRIFELTNVFSLKPSKEVDEGLMPCCIDLCKKSIEWVVQSEKADPEFIISRIIPSCLILLRRSHTNLLGLAWSSINSLVRCVGALRRGP